MHCCALLCTAHLLLPRHAVPCRYWPCIALPCLAVHCIALFGLVRALHCLALPCIALHCLALPCNALPCIALRCIALRCVALRCAALRCVALRCVGWFPYVPLRARFSMATPCAAGGSTSPVSLDQAPLIALHHTRLKGRRLAFPRPTSVGRGILEFMGVGCSLVPSGSLADLPSQWVPCEEKIGYRFPSIGCFHLTPVPIPGDQGDSVTLWGGSDW